MINPITAIKKNLTLRICLMVFYGLVLLTITLVAMFQFAHKALKDEAMSCAEQTLDATVQQIDNILLSVEQASGNVYMELIQHLDQPERMLGYAQKVVESNEYIDGCAIVFRPDYYPGHHLYMAYMHRHCSDESVKGFTRPLVAQDTFTDRPYTEQRWYTEPMKSKRACWIDPLKNQETECNPLVTFCLPIYDPNRECVGVMGVDVKIELLSQIILAVKPSPRGYATMLARNGSFIVHPDKSKLTVQTVFVQLQQGADASVQEAAEAMLAGEQGEKPFWMDGELWHVFYRPFVRTQVPGRAMEPLAWSVGVVYPVDDIYGDVNRLFNYLIGGSALALLVLFVLLWIVVSRQLKPLELLTRSARRIARGDYDQQLPDTHRQDEIGQLQDSFNHVQQSLTAYIRRQRHLQSTLKERGQALAQTYENAKQNNKVKAKFLHHMTNQMVEPAELLDKSVTRLCNEYGDMTLEEATHEVEVIEEESKVIVDLTDQMLTTAQDQTGKEEDAHE